MLINLKIVVNTEAVVQKELPFEIDDVISYEEGGMVYVAKVVSLAILDPERTEIKDSRGYSFVPYFTYDPANPHDSRNTKYKLMNRTKNFPKQ